METISLLSQTKDVLKEAFQSLDHQRKECRQILIDLKPLEPLAKSIRKGS